MSSLRAILVFNPFTFVDEIMKDSLLKCIYSIHHCPDSLQEYVDYFYSVLTQTADKIPGIQTGKGIHPFLTIEDRIAILKGCLAHINFQKRMNLIEVPIIVVHSKENCLVQIDRSYEIFEVTLYLK